MNRYEELTPKDIGKQFRITGWAMIDRNELKVTNQPAIFRDPVDWDYCYTFDIPVDLLKLALPEHVMQVLDEEFRSEEQPDTHRRVDFFIEDIDSIESEPEITLQSLLGRKITDGPLR